MPTVAELGQRVKAKYPGTYDDLPDDELGRKVKAKYPGSYDDYADAAPELAPMATNTQPNEPVTGFQNRVLEGLPTAGGFVGGLVGKVGGYPGAVAGAGAGGALGEGVRQVAAGEELSPEGMGKQGLEQAAYEAAGGAIGKGASMAARPLMRNALGVGKAIGGKVKVGSSLFRDPAEKAIEKRVLVNPKGALKATAMREDSAAELSKIINTAKLGGKKFDTKNVSKHVMKMLKDPVLPTKEKEKILTELIGFIKDKGLKLDAGVLQGVKTYYQQQAKIIAKQGAESLADQPSKKFAKAMRQGAQEELEKIPGVAARNAETQDLIGLERAVTSRVQRPSAAFEIQKPGTIPVLRSLTSPGNTSRLALALTHPEIQTALRQSPRAAAELIQQMLLSDEPDATAQ